MSGTPEDELRMVILWPLQVRSSKARLAWRLAVYATGYALTHAGTHDGRRGALSVPHWVNRVLTAVDLAIPRANGDVVVEAASRVLRDPDLCQMIRVAWSLGSPRRGA